jgi:DNA mismatch repair ATPase MutS
MNRSEKQISKLREDEARLEGFIASTQDSIKFDKDSLQRYLTSISNWKADLEVAGADYSWEDFRPNSIERMDALYETEREEKWLKHIIKVEESIVDLTKKDMKQMKEELVDFKKRLQNVRNEIKELEKSSVEKS